MRLEEAQPYVVAYLEESGVSKFIDLVIKNFGSTAATDVKATIDPEPRRALEARHEGFKPLLPDVIPVLVPGQEWRNLFDTTMARGTSELPRRYEATVAFKDSRGRKLDPLQYILDWDPLLNRASVTKYGLHDAAKALKEIEGLMAKGNSWYQGTRRLCARWRRSR